MNERAPLGCGWLQATQEPLEIHIEKNHDADTLTVSSVRHVTLHHLPVVINGMTHDAGIPDSTIRVNFIDYSGPLDPPASR